MLLLAAGHAFEMYENGVMPKSHMGGLGMDRSHAVQTWEWRLR